MEKPNRNYLLIKFGTLAHLKELIEGKIYCKNLSYFSKLKDEKIRGDEFEIVVVQKYLENMELALKPINTPNAEWTKIKVTHGWMKTSVHEPKGNLYCLSGFCLYASKKPKLFQLNEKFKEFGTHFLLIENAPIFLDKIRKSIEGLGYPYSDGNVKYIDLKSNPGKKLIFQKDIEFQWQEEYRFYIESGLAEPLILNIGNISAISKLHKLIEVDKFYYKSP